VNDQVISVYPNPVKDKFTIYDLRSTIDRIEIYNPLGQLVQHSPLFWRVAGSEAVDVSMLSPGIYFVRLVGEREQWVGKFIKE